MFGGNGSVIDLTAATDSGGLDTGATFVVPPEFLFHGDFKRAGSDLKITDEHGKVFVVIDYFKTDKPHTLFAPDGAALAGDVVAALAGPLAPGQYAQATAPQGAGEAIGRVANEQGTAVAVRNGVAVTLNVGDVVLKGDVIQTQANSKVGIIFADGSTFDLGANARMVLNDFVYNASAGSGNSALINLVQGSFTFVAGQLAHTGDMKVGTPVATMGIRGTAVQVDINLSDGTTKLSLLIEPGNKFGEFNVYSLSGQLLETVTNPNNTILVTPVAPLQAIATLLPKSPTDLAQALTAVQQVFQTKAVGEAIMQANPLPQGNNNTGNPNDNNNNNTPNPNDQQHDQQNNNQQTTNPTSTAPKTQIQSTDVSTTKITVDVTQTPTDTNVNVTVTPPPDNTPPTQPLILQAPPTQTTVVTNTTPTPPPVLISATSPSALVEATDSSHPGTSASVVVLTLTDAANTTFDATTLLANGWQDTGNGTGVFTKSGSYGIVALSTVTGTLSYTLDNERYPTDHLAANQVVHEQFTVPVVDQGTNGSVTVNFEVDGRNDAPVVSTTNVFNFQNGFSAWHTDGQVIQVYNAEHGVCVADLQTGATTNVSADAIESFLGLPAGTLANLNAGPDGNTTPTQGTAIAKDFVLHAGETLTFDWDFSTADFSPWKDFAFYSVSTTAYELTNVLQVGDYGDSGWQTVTFTAPTDGAYHFGFGVMDGGDTALESDLLIDNIHVGAAASALSTYTENQAPAAIDPALVLSDVDSATLAGATVKISGGLHSAEDVLGFADQNGIHGSYDSATGILTLTGTASLAAYETALRSVTYFNSSDNPSADARTISFQVDDGSSDNNLSNTGSVTVSVVPVNDAPAVTSPATTEVSQNDGVQTFTAAGLLASLHAADAEHDTLKIVDLTLLDPNGNPLDLNNLPLGVTVNFNDDGSLNNFSIDAGNFTYLGADHSVTLIANFTVSDGNGGETPASAHLIVDGTDDAPVITSAAQSGQVSEGDGQPAASRSATGQVTYSDVDTGDTHSFTIDTAAAYGVASVDADGTWHYTVTDAGAVDALGQGATLPDSFIVKVADNHGGFATQTVAITITGTNDAPLITSAPQSGQVSEGDGQPAASRTATGQVTYSDVDTGDTHSFSIDAAAAYGVASVDADGTWHYTVTDAGAVDALGQGDTLGDSFTVKVADNNGLFATQTVAIAITGTDDAPVISGATTVASGSIAELAGTNNAATDTASGTISFTDVDLSDRPTVAAAFASYAYTAADGHTALTLTADQQSALETTLAVAPDGGNTNTGSATWTYSVADNALDFLAQGETLKLTYTATVDDHQTGGTVTTPITVTIHGTDDAPVANNDTGAVTAGSGPLTGNNVLDNDSDPELEPHDAAHHQCQARPGGRGSFHPRRHLRHNRCGSGRQLQLHAG